MSISKPRPSSDKPADPEIIPDDIDDATLRARLDLRPQLRVADRCDRCIAQAHVVVEISYSAPRDGVTEGSLYLCGHHYEAHSEALKEAGVRILADTRQSLTKRSNEVHA